MSPKMKPRKNRQAGKASITSNVNSLEPGSTSCTASCLEIVCMDKVATDSRERTLLLYDVLKFDVRSPAQYTTGSPYPKVMRRTVMKNKVEHDRIISPKRERKMSSVRERSFDVPCSSTCTPLESRTKPQKALVASKKHIKSCR